MTNQITEELVYWGRAEPPNEEEPHEETDSEMDLEAQSPATED